MEITTVATLTLEGPWLNRCQRPSFLFGDDGSVYALIEDQESGTVRLTPQPQKRITYTIKEG